MKYIKLFLFIQYLMFCQQYSSLDAKALIGRNIRAARRNEFSFVVSISVKNPTRNPFRDHLCTGTLITKQHVLSAEHCMRCSLVLCRVIVGSRILSEGKRYKVDSWITYEQWAAEKNIEPEYEDNDITVITLENQVTEANVEPVVLTGLSDADLIGSNVVIASWGHGNDGVLCTHLQTVQLAVLTREECKRQIDASAGEETGPVPGSILCTKATPYALLGGGDSGGPLLDTNNNLIAVNIATCPNNGVEHDPTEVNVHVTIPFYREFINSVIY